MMFDAFQSRANQAREIQIIRPIEIRSWISEQPHEAKPMP
jgi:hypothetical protein